MIIYLATSASTSGLIPNGVAFIQGADGPLRPLSSIEYATFDFYAKRGIPFRLADKPGDEIEKVALSAGLRLWSSLTDNVPTLTGDIKFKDRVVRDYPVPGTGGNAPTVVETAAEVKKVLKADFDSMIPARRAP